MQHFTLKLDDNTFRYLALFIKEYVTQEPAGYEMQLEQCILAEFLVRQARNIAFPKAVVKLSLKPAEAVSLNRIMQKVLALSDCEIDLRKLAYGIVMAIDTKLISS